MPRKKSTTESILDIMRHSAGSIGQGESVDVLNGLSTTEKKDFIAECSVIFKGQAFKKTLQHLIAQQKDVCAFNISNWEADLFAKGTINGFQLVYDTFLSFSQQHDDITKSDREDE